MSRAAARRRGHALACLVAGGLGAARAEGPQPAQVAAIAPAPAPVARTPPPYVDRVLETGPQPAIDAASEPDTEGWARNLRLDYVLSVNRGPVSGTSRGIAASGFIETPQHGTLSLQGSVVDNNADAGTPVPLARVAHRTTTWRLDQRALPLEGGWLADHGIGDIATGVPSLAHGLSRIYLPSSPIAGAGGRWQFRDDVQLNASAGQPGLFSGFDVNGFETSRGRLATAGGQVRIAGQRQAGSRMDAAVQAIEARDAPELGIPQGSHATGTWAAFAWEGSAPWGPGVSAGNGAEALGLRPGGAALQANVLQSSGVGARATGAWADAAWRDTLVQNTAGAYRLEPNLRWGTTQMPADLVGAYWRAQLPARQWQLGWDLEASDSVSGASARSAFGSIYGRYQLDLRDAVDGTLSVRTNSGAGDSLQLAWDHGSDWGQTRWRASTLHGRHTHTDFFGADQAWALSAPNVLQTSLGWQSTRGDGSTAPVWTWGVLGSMSPAWGWTLDASVQGAQGGGAESLLASVSLNWQFARDWLLAARYTESHGRDPQQVQVVSALTAATQALATPVPASRSLQVVLRYEMRAGTLPVPLGGSRTSGAGTVSGTVFFDADRNGRREASEAGAPNVTVVLDGRYSTRTDAGGHYEFPWVAAGEHTVQVIPDNVPLPWSATRTEAVKTQVLVRGRTVEDFPLQRDR